MEKYYLIQIMPLKRKKTNEYNNEEMETKKCDNKKGAYKMYLDTIFEYLNKEKFDELVKGSFNELEIDLIEVDEKRFKFTYEETFCIKKNNFYKTKTENIKYDFKDEKGYVKEINNKMKLV